MITPSFGLTATERVLPRLALDFTTASLDPRVTFTRTTGASNPATFINSSGVITAATNDQPRFDYDPVTLVCKGLLIEESRTNALLNSLINGANLTTQSVTVTAAARTLSFYGTGQIVLSGAHSATITGTGVYPTRTTFTFTPSAGTLTLTVTGAVQFAQLESGTFATSFIPTADTALTRNVDVATMTGTNFSSWFNASEGTFINQIQTFAPYIVGKGSESINVTGASDEINMSINSGVANSGYNVIAIGGADAGTYRPALTPNTTAKSGFGWKTNVGTRFGFNGTTANKTSGAVATTNPSLTALRIGSRATNSYYLNGWITNLYFYPQMLTQSELNAFTK